MPRHGECGDENLTYVCVSVFVCFVGGGNKRKVRVRPERETR